MTDTYKSLRTSLLRTKKSLIEACKEINFDIEQIDFDALDLSACDNCFYWHTNKTMKDDGYGLYCHNCVKLNLMTF
jgi:multimeric flavodoxin WrbA